MPETDEERRLREFTEQMAQRLAEMNEQKRREEAMRREEDRVVRYGEINSEKGK